MSYATFENRPSPLSTGEREQEPVLTFLRYTIRMFRSLPPALLLLFPLGGFVFLLGINWRLPPDPSLIDPYLFNNHPRWTGEQILKLAGPTEDTNRGADV